MIFAAITNTPCMFFDNTNRKVSGVYKWLEQYKYIRFLKNTESFEQELKEMITELKLESKFDNTSFSDYFKNILEE